MIQRINQYLDRHILPWPVRFMTFRLVIIATMALLLPLLLWANNTILVLALNSYLNVMSVAVSSIVLLYSTLTELRQRQIAAMQEERAREDHEHLTMMYTLLQRELGHQRSELQQVRQLVLEEKGNVGVRTSAPVNLTQDLRAMHPRGVERFAYGEGERRASELLATSPLLEVIDAGVGGVLPSP